MSEFMNNEKLIEKVEDYASKVFFYCVKRCNNRMDAEDLSQTILLEIIQNINKGAQIDNMDYYVWGVCKNQFNMYLRKTIKDRSKIEYAKDINVSDNSLSALDKIIEDEKIKKINGAIKLLSKDYAQILYAYYIEDKTLKYIAEELNMPLGTVKKRLFTIRKKLKEYLDMETLNGKKAYIPKMFASSASYNKVLPFDPHEIVKPLFIKNLLYHTYNNPCTIEELSIEMGMSKPYVEDVVNILLGVQYLIKDGNKYKANIAFLDKETVNKVRNGLTKYYDEYIDSVIEFATRNVENYRSKLIDKDISDGLLMWSLLMTIRSYIKEPKIKYTKHYGSGGLSFCMYEVSEMYDEKDYYISWNGFGNKNEFKLYGQAYPASAADYEGIPKIHNRIKFNKAATGFRENANIFSNIVFNNLEYDKLEKPLKKEVDNAIELNYLKVENNILKVVVPMMEEEDFENFKWIILEDSTLNEEFLNLYNRAKELVTKEIPDYLEQESNCLVHSIINDLRTRILLKADKLNLLDYDEKHPYFVYNMLLVKCK